MRGGMAVPLLGILACVGPGNSCVGFWVYLYPMDLMKHLALCCSSSRPEHHFLEAICCFPMVYYMEGTIDK